MACLREEEDEFEEQRAERLGNEEKEERKREGRIGWRHFEAALRGRRKEEEEEEEEDDSDGSEEG